MRVRRRLIVWSVVGMLALAAAGTAWAAPKYVAFKGKVAQVGNGQIGVVDDKGTPVSLVAVNKDTQFSVNGKALPDFLTNGVCVQFMAMMNKKKEVLEPVKDVMVCDFSEQFPPMLAPADGPDAALAMKKNPDAPVKFFVRGKIQANKDGTLQVAYNNKETVSVQLAEDATINVSVTNPALIKNGDLIEVAAHEVVPASADGKTPSQVLGLRVVINTANPLTSKKGPAAAAPAATPPK